MELVDHREVTKDFYPISLKTALGTVEMRVRFRDNGVPRKRSHAIVLVGASGDAGGQVSLSHT